MEELDLRGLKCPLPALRTEKRLAMLGPGAIIEVLADDPLAPLDIRHLCNGGGHRLLRETQMEGHAWRFTIEAG